MPLKADPRNPEYVKKCNATVLSDLETEYEILGRQLGRRGVAIDAVTEAVARFAVAIPSWGVGTGGTRFARFPGTGEPRNVYEKLDDCAVIHSLTAWNLGLETEGKEASDTESFTFICSHVVRG